MTTKSDNQTTNQGSWNDSDDAQQAGLKDRVRDRAGAARTRASEAYDAARERTRSAYGTVRESAGTARRRTGEGIESNPVAALVGGLALGGLLAAILPKTQREEELFGDYGRRINDRARDAARAAKDAGQSKLEELGYTKETAREKLESLKSDASEIARTAAQRVKGDAREVANAVAQETKSAAQQPR